MNIVGAVLGVIVGATLLVIGFLGNRERLTAKSPLGVHSEAALRDEETFTIANKVASVPWMIGGSIALLGGLVSLTALSTVIAVVATVLSLLAAVALSVAGGGLGTRAAEAIPAKPDNCATCTSEGGCAIMALKNC